MAQLEYTGIGWRYVLDKERHHRERLWNYKGCAIYHITLNTEQRFPIFGTIAGETEDTAYISLSTFGKAVADMFRGIPGLSGNLVGISINLCKSIQKELFINDTP